MRKIIQIAAVPRSDGNPEALYALCSDGTVWERYRNRWYQIDIDAIFGGIDEE